MRGNTEHLVFCVCMAFVLLGAFAGVSVASARMIYVPDDYTTIQGAVDNATDGDTIIVKDGSFHENIKVDKPLTLRSENGSKNCIIQAATYDDAFHVTADYVNIYGFIIEGGTYGIHLDNAKNCNIANNNISNNGNEGIHLEDSSNNIIMGNSISDNDYGIYLWRSSNNVIIGNSISDNRGGIFLWFSSSNNITGNTMTNDGVSIYGYELWHWNTHTIENNTVNGKPLYYFKDKVGGKVPEDAGQVILANCTGMLVENLNIRNTDVGIKIGFSSQNTIKNNNISNNGDGIYLYESSNNILANNTVSSNNIYGIYLDDSSNNILANNIISLNGDNGIDLSDSGGNQISNNTISSNNGDGINLWDSGGNQISNNIISLNGDNGIYLDQSNGNQIYNNTISSNNGDGINLRNSGSNLIMSNVFTSDGLFGGSYQNTVEGNIVNGKPLIYLEGESDRVITDAGQVILINCNNITAKNLNLSNTDVGVELWNSNNCKIVNNTISSNDNDGIWLWGSDGNQISSNIISSNDDDGIWLRYSDGNRICNNNLSSNGDDGIDIRDSDNNKIYLNNFIDNYHNVYSWESDNFWNSKEKIAYTYKGHEYKGYMGNYWDDYKGGDANGDGIGDTPYYIQPYYYILNKDYYPLMEPFENYFAPENQPPVASFTYTPERPTVDQAVTFDASASYDPDGTIVSYGWDFGDGNVTITTEETIKHSYSEAGSYEVTLTVTDDDGATNSTTKIITVYSPTAIFDTGRPENPYPSILGEFVGTIKTNTTIIATKLYTYACEGTGGHTEYVIICNSTWCAEAKWEGYRGDWMNISFNRTVVLMPHETYNITIVTGSYPQIHHTPSLKTENGWINCTEFTDANGNKYENWIPAIKLWS